MNSDIWKVEPVVFVPSGVLHLPIIFNEREISDAIDMIPVRLIVGSMDSDK